MEKDIVTYVFPDGSSETHSDYHLVFAAESAMKDNKPLGILPDYKVRAIEDIDGLVVYLRKW